MVLKFADDTYKLILTSYGLNTDLGTTLIAQVLKKERIELTSIFLIVPERYQLDDILFRACIELGIRKDSIYFSKDYENMDISSLPYVDAVYCTEGNIFEIMDYMRKNQFDAYAKANTTRGAIYFGCSAGAMVASCDFKLAEDFDINRQGMDDYRGLGLLPDNDTVIPHYNYRELQRYLDISQPEEIGNYTHIYNCSDEEAFIMDVKMHEGKPTLERKRRIRIRR